VQQAGVDEDDLQLQFVIKFKSLYQVQTTALLKMIKRWLQILYINIFYDF
jgi:hypothetical protein